MRRNRSALLGEYQTQPGVVVYVAAEGVAGLPSRLRAWLKHHGLKHLALDRWYCLPDPLNMMLMSNAAALVDAVKSAASDQAVGMVVLDTMARSMPGGDENSAMDVGLVIANADHIRKELRAAVLIVHHTGKNGDQERGSTALRGSADAMYQSIPDTSNPEYIRLKCTKMKDAESPGEIRTKRVVVDVDDENNETSCVVVPDDNERMHRTDQQTLAGLQDLMPFNPSGVTNKQWRDQLALTFMPARTFQRCRERLVSQGIVTKDKPGRGAKYKPAATYGGNGESLMLVPDRCQSPFDS